MISIIYHISRSLSKWNKDESVVLSDKAVSQSQVIVWLDFFTNALLSTCSHHLLELLISLHGFTLKAFPDRACLDSSITTPSVHVNHVFQLLGIIFHLSSYSRPVIITFEPFPTNFGLIFLLTGSRNMVLSILKSLKLNLRIILLVCCGL